ncbi:type 1 periplasmic binding fold superfamily protein [Dokdonia sp. Hel_I_53]|uniref:type 1 periplasmic binding fold superfamily protein n=1 Tax=Dokdonia sp. Hel_I_53 TaxID=1566287 RepID=UPI00119AA6D5|nr:type 1 periplasmic binding fold superfamily protein [Dokdonia sp. Hel_I_53]TVZ51049.1 hypothetical protein OD90_0185 [Dokdonia sp. Hel_I_53]
MKKIIYFTTVLFISLTIFSCIDNDDDGLIPQVINEEEVISTVQITLTNTVDGEVIVLRSVDTDGEGGDEPVITVSDNLDANTNYTSRIQFLNETVSPAENITEEVEEEALEHQIIFTVQTSLDTNITYSNFDSNGNPLGTEIALVTGNPSAGNITVTLRHEPSKPNDGTLNGAGGETDAQVVFPVIIE